MTDPRTCPTCGSDDPNKRACGGGLRSECPHGHDDCPDSFHNLEFIGDLRRRLFADVDCEWNGVVRDITAQMERPGMLVNAGLVCVHLSEFYRARAHWARFKEAINGE